LIVDDVPFLIARFTALGGRTAPPEAELAYFRTNGKLRIAPLRPAIDVASLCDHATQKVAALDGQSSQQAVVKQLLFLVDAAYAPPAAYADGPFNQQLDAIKTDLAKLSFRWNAESSRYDVANRVTTIPK